MPYIDKYVEPDIALAHNGVTVYCTYDDDNYEVPHRYWFTTNVEDNSNGHFDVRDLLTPSRDLMAARRPPGLSVSEGGRLSHEWYENDEPKLILAILREAIDLGLIK